MNLKLIQIVPHHIILEVNTPVSWKAATKASLRGKKTLKTQISGYFFIAKTEECDQKNWSECNKIGMSISSTTTNFLEVGARFSLKVARKGLFTGKETLNTKIFRIFF